jgi:hypothetical protein
VEHFEGSPQVQTASDTRWRPVKLYDVYCKGDKLKVDRGGEVDLKLLDDVGVAGAGGLVKISYTGGEIWTVNPQDVADAQRNFMTIDVGSLAAIIFVALIILLAAFNVFRIPIPPRFLRLIEYLGNIDLARKAK